MVDVFRLSDIGLALGSGTRVIKRDAMRGITQADDIVAAARERAGEIILDAELARAQERERGYAEGTQAARREAVERLLAEHAALDAALERTRSQLTELVLNCTRALVADMNPVDVATSFTRSALGQMRREKRCQLFVPSALQADVQARIDGVLADFPEVELIDVVEDPALVPPAIVLSSPLGRVSCAVDEMMDDLADIVRGAIVLARPAVERAVPTFGPAHAATDGSGT